jgi:hypothetical protein
MAKLQVPIPDDLMARLKAIAASRRMTLQSYVNKTLERSTKTAKKVTK